MMICRWRLKGRIANESVDPFGWKCAPYCQPFNSDWFELESTSLSTSPLICYVKRASWESTMNWELLPTFPNTLLSQTDRLGVEVKVFPSKAPTTTDTLKPNIFRHSNTQSVQSYVCQVGPVIRELIRATWLTNYIYTQDQQLLQLFLSQKYTFYPNSITYLCTCIFMYFHLKTLF